MHSNRCLKRQSHWDLNDLLPLQLRLKRRELIALLNLVMSFAVISIGQGKAQAATDSSRGLAQEQKQECKTDFTTVGVMQISTIFNADTHVCWVSVHNNTSYKTLRYRDFMFGNDGLFFVFNSFGEGPPSEKTGAREFYTFPRRGYPSFVIDSDNQLVQITLTTGETMLFDARVMKLLSMSDSKFTEDPQITPKNRGGFEVKSHTRLLLDCGFEMGNSPSSNPKRICQFSDAHGKICSLRAGELFDYDSDGDNALKFQDDSALADFLSTKCTNLDISPLVNPK